MSEKYNEIFVEVDSKNINNNNIQHTNPFQCFRLNTNEKIEIPHTIVNNAGAVCDLCFQKFSTYSDLFKHKSKLCYLDAIQSPPFPNPIKITFPSSHLVYIEDGLQSLNIPIENDVKNDSNVDTKFIIVDETNLVIIARRLYVLQVTKYNLEYWYEDLRRLANQNNEEEYTAKTKIFPLSDDQLKTLSKWSSINLSDAIGMPVRPTNAELKNREEMEDLLTTFIGENNEKDYFCKFSTRSPKDAVSLRDIDPNLPLAEKMKLKYDKLKVKEGLKTFDLLTRSQRIFSDINLFFQYRILNSSSGDLAIILREWDEKLRQDYEFRCYVHNRKVTAISQYNCYCYFESLQDEEHAKRIRSSITSFIDKVSGCIRTPSFVIDIGVLEDYSCQVIELNPFGAYMSSGSALFNWLDDYDLLHGNLEGFDYPSIRILKYLIDDEKKDIGC